MVADTYPAIRIRFAFVGVMDRTFFCGVGHIPRWEHLVTDLGSRLLAIINADGNGVLYFRRIPCRIVANTARGYESLACFYIQGEQVMRKRNDGFEDDG